MVKLSISQNYLTVVLYKNFLTFSKEKNESFWKFQKVVECSDNIKSNDGSIECCAFSPCAKYFGVCFDKNIIIYNPPTWDVLYVSPGERKASDLRFFPRSRVLLLADKSGCASFYSFDDKFLKTDLTLGHNSMLTNALITDDEKYVITSDRDEKIRVTNYPNVYNIKIYCLGHKMFVTFVDFLPTDKRILVSSSGDGTLRFWDFVSGSELSVYNCNTDNSKTTITKFVMCNINDVSIVAISEYKSNQIRILSVKGNLNLGLKVELIKVLKLNSVAWDITFFAQTLICLLPNQSNPFLFWSLKNDFTETQNSFQNITDYFRDNWDMFLSISHKISDEIPVLFKREVDNIQEYEKRKKARLLKTGKTS